MRGLILIVFLSIFSISCMQFRTNDKKVRENFASKGVKVEIAKKDINGKNIRFIKTGNHHERLIVFIHGAPGSSQDYHQFLEDSTLINNFTMIAVDRPGYGFSDFGKSEKSIIEQSTIINSAIKEEILKYDDILFIGHSYGGPVAAYLAIMNKNQNVKLIMLAPAIDPAQEKVFWFSHLVEIPPFSWLTPKAFKVAADEKFSHAQALRQIEYSWKEINFQVIHVHGTDDILVPFKSIDFSKKNIPAEYLKIIELKDVNHFLPWSHTELIKDLILNKEVDLSQSTN